MPIWKDIPGFEGRYQINDAGVVKYLATGQYLKPIIGDHGNPILCLHAAPGTHTGTWVKIHQLVAARRAASLRDTRNHGLTDRGIALFQKTYPERKQKNQNPFKGPAAEGKLCPGNHS